MRSAVRIEHIYRSICVFAVALFLATASNTNTNATQKTDNYHDLQLAWRAEREANLLSDGGWLTIDALYFLREGDNSFGSSPLNDLVISEGPMSTGIFEKRDEKVSLRTTTGQTVVVNGQSVASMQLYPSDERNILVVGNLSMWVHYSGDRLAIRVRNPNSELRRTFRGLNWFPIDSHYRVQGQFIPHDKPMTIMLPNILGDLEPFTSHGSVEMTVKGHVLTMLPMTSGNRLWFIFRDLTSGKETYPAARFLYADAPDQDGLTTIDFNQAYNPPCAFNPYTTCPLPPEPNRLSLRIEAGEMDYH